jgi:hypothetical protein
LKEYTASGPYLLLVQASQNGEEKRTGSMKEPYAMEDVCEAAVIEGWYRRCEDRTEGGTGKGEKK